MAEVPYHIIVKSRDVPIDSCLAILKRVNQSIANSRGVIREEIRFTDSEKMVDATTAFTGAFIRPISLENFADGSDDLVGLVRYSHWHAIPADLEHQLLTTVDEVLRWEQSDFSINISIMFEGSIAPFIGVERSRDKRSWKCYTDTFNEAIRRGSVSVESQKDAYDRLAHALGAPFGQSECYFEIVDGYLQFHSGPDPRVYCDDGNLGFGDARMQHRLVIRAEDQETPLIVDALKSYIEYIQLTGRVAVRIGLLRDHYEAWREAFEHREAAYEYQFQGFLTNSAIDFLSGKSTSVPKGVVPYAQYWSQRKGGGGVSLSLDFADDSVRFCLSGTEKVSEEGMKDFLRETGLMQYTDESCMIFH
ncbi:hypothetical protein RMSM_04724 [Rhodopirellula maiorica SM1]|uniref:Uncharacterized protein n=1 Tax=Rhodopirellula maiorica SM1 TaxID=1265738 RepID=M5RSK7_9BACT|nr:hypothetical protein [Rhodopirellula maiorica]EMI18362.1 hypothetical protein RMSM_04724 [Rhodopirellula maiorica SM1]